MKIQKYNNEEETNMNYYIDSLGRLIYESCNMKSEIVGVEFIQEDYILFKIELLWE